MRVSNVISLIFKIFIFFLLFSGIINCKKDNLSDRIDLKPEYHDYTGKDINDFLASKEYDLKVVNFWATFCAPCKKEIHDLVQLNSEYKNKKVLFVGASIDKKDKINLIKKLSNALKINYPVLYGVEAFYNAEEVTGLPTTYFLDKNNKVLEKVVNKRSYADFKVIIDKYINQSKDSLASSDKGAVNTISSEYFSLSAELDNQQNILLLTLKPGEDYYLNGEGYPPIKLTISERNNIIFNPVVLNTAGIDEGETYTWQVAFEQKGDEILKALEVKLSAIACIDESCNFVNEIVSIKL